MLNAKQIAAIIRSTVHVTHDDDGVLHKVEEAAEKIYDLVKPDYSSHVAAAALENEVTSTLMDMLAATILATLINEEGGGRTNIRFSPGSMQEALSEWDYITVMEGMVRNVRITPKNPEAWENNEPPSKLESLLVREGQSDEDAEPQAAAHEYQRPVWVVAYTGLDSGTVFSRQHDRASAERELRAWPDGAHANAHIENRWCLHPECPSTGCTKDASLRDEVTSAE